MRRSCSPRKAVTQRAPSTATARRGVPGTSTVRSGSSAPTGIRATASSPLSTTHTAASPRRRGRSERCRPRRRAQSPARPARTRSACWSATACPRRSSGIGSGLPHAPSPASRTRAATEPGSRAMERRLGPPDVAVSRYFDTGLDVRERRSPRGRGRRSRPAAGRRRWPRRRATSISIRPDERRSARWCSSVVRGLSSDSQSSGSVRGASRRVCSSRIRVSSPSARPSSRNRAPASSGPSSATGGCRITVRSDSSTTTRIGATPGELTSTTSASTPEP